MKKKFRGPPYPPKKADFGCLKAKMEYNRPDPEYNRPDPEYNIFQKGLS